MRLHRRLALAAGLSLAGCSMPWHLSRPPASVNLGLDDRDLSYLAVDATRPLMSLWPPARTSLRRVAFSAHAEDPLTSAFGLTMEQKLRLAGYAVFDAHAASPSSPLLELSGHLIELPVDPPLWCVQLRANQMLLARAYRRIHDALSPTGRWSGVHMTPAAP